MGCTRYGWARSPHGPIANVSPTSPDFYFYDLNAKITDRPAANESLAVTVYNGQDYLDNAMAFDQAVYHTRLKPHRYG